MEVECRNLGTMPYRECWQLQQRLFDGRLSLVGSGDGDAGTVLFVEHPPVFTLGKSGHEENMLLDGGRLEALGAEFIHIDRGGDITFHGPGQTVCYPILDLGRIGIGLRRYVEILEQSVIDTVAGYGIRGERLKGATGDTEMAHGPEKPQEKTHGPSDTRKRRMAAGARKNAFSPVKGAEGTKERKMIKNIIIKNREYAYRKEVGCQTAGQSSGGGTHIRCPEDSPGIGQPVGTKRHRHCRKG